MKLQQDGMVMNGMLKKPKNMLKRYHVFKDFNQRNVFKVNSFFQRLDAEQMKEIQEQKPSKIVPNSNYKEKYVHLIGHEAALEAAKRTESNKTYGFGMNLKI